MNGRLLAALALGLAVVGLAGWLALGRAGLPGGPKVAADNPCEHFPSLDGALSDWMRGWRRLEPALTCEHFALVSSSRALLTAETPVGARLPPVEDRWRSPDGRQVLVPSRGEAAVSELALIDEAAGRRRVVLRDESGGGWKDGAWMDASAFVAAGEVPGSLPGTVAPTLTVVRLDRNESTLFRGPDLKAPRVEAPEPPPVP